MDVEVSPLVGSFVEACRRHGLDDAAVKVAAARAVGLHPELRDEFTKAGFAILPAVIGAAGLAGLALPFFSSNKDKPPAAPSADANWRYKPKDEPDVKVTSGAPPSNPYAMPGAGGMAPRFWPSMAMPPGGFPGSYGPGGMPGSPFARNPFSHTVVPAPIPGPPVKYSGAADLEKEAFLGLAPMALTGARMLANSGVGRLVGRGLSSLGSTTGSKAIAGAGQKVLNTGTQRAGVLTGRAARTEKNVQHMMATKKFATPAEAQAYLDAHGGRLAAAQAGLATHGTARSALEMARAAAPGPGWFGRHSTSLIMGGLTVPFLLPQGGGEMPQQPPMPTTGGGGYDGFEHQAGFALPPTIGVEKAAVPMFGPPEGIPASPRLADVGVAPRAFRDRVDGRRDAAGGRTGRVLPNRGERLDVRSGGTSGKLDLSLPAEGKRLKFKEVAKPPAGGSTTATYTPPAEPAKPAKSPKPAKPAFASSDFEAGKSLSPSPPPAAKPAKPVKPPTTAAAPVPAAPARPGLFSRLGSGIGRGAAGLARGGVLGAGAFGLGYGANKLLGLTDTPVHSAPQADPSMSLLKTSSTFLGEGLFGPVGGAVEAPSGHRVEGVGRGLLASTMTSLGAVPGMALGAAAGGALRNPVLGALLGAGAGGYGGYRVGQGLMGKPSWKRKDDKKDKKDKKDDKTEKKGSANPFVTGREG